MNNENDRWERLVKAAHRAPAETSAEPPFGFATRVAARWASGEQVAITAPWERLALRTLAFAAVLMVASLTVNFDLLGKDLLTELSPADPVFGNLLEP